MDPDEIAAAADRLRRVASGEGFDDVYADFAAKAGQRLMDYVTCADAYLAEHAELPNHEPGKPLPMTPDTWRWLIGRRQMLSDGDSWIICTLCEHLLAEHADEPCQHKRTKTIREGVTGQLGTVVCLDCGHEREFEAY